MVDQAVIDRAKAHFASIVEDQLARVERLKNEPDWLNYQAMPHVIVGVCGGDGIGPFITREAVRVLQYILAPEVTSRKIEFRTIEGLTIENRAAQNKALPDEVVAELHKCHAVLKGPTTTPQRGDSWPNIESANVAMRRELDLFANVRPVRVPSQGIDWMFFRENTEGAYILGSRGVRVTDDLGFDFTAVTMQGSERLIRLAFDHAAKTGKNKVTVVHKANIIKLTDGMFLDVAQEVAKDYPNVEWDDWIVDIMTAKLIDPQRRTQFKVIAAPNLYGDIITDEAAEFQGGVGTAGSANLGKQNAMFEAIHGSAPRMVNEGRAQYANPTSMIVAGKMMLEHMGYTDRAQRLDMALDICGQYEKKLVMTSRATGATGTDYADYVMATLADPNLEQRWRGYADAK
ncbi:MAG TPA: isocitrate/isopropylmalate family dehydrogenase [Dehalococcoidia bacterium]|nr:isocitrate/isopropylmalate family dehydrogenase [Dehalococcoidia bacterium]